MIRRILRWAHARRVLVLAAAALLAAASALSLRRLTFDANVLHMLPRDGVAVPAFREYFEQFGSLDYLYVIVDAPEGGSIEDDAATIEALVAKLRAAPEIAHVDAGPRDRARDWRYLSDRVLLLLVPGTPGTPGEAGVLDRFDRGHLAAQLATTRELLSLPSAEMADLVRADPLGLLLSLRDRLAGAASGMKLDAAAAGAYVSADGRSQLILARPTGPPFDTGFGRELFARLHAIEADVATAHAAAGDGTPPPRIRFAGGHAIALEMEGLLRGESIWNAIGALVVILPLLYFAFRSPWLVAVGAVPSALAVLVVMAAYAWLGIPLSAAAAGASAMQFGLGIDGVVLLFVAHRHVGRIVADDGGEDLAGPSMSMLLGMWTTAATFYGLAVVDFPSLEELGLLIGHSMVVCGLLTLVLVPALLPARAAAVPPLTTAWLPRLVGRHRLAILVAAGVATVAALVVAPRLRIDPSLDRLRGTSPATTFEAEVATRFGVPRDVFLVVDRGPALEPLLEANERLAAALTREAPGVPFHAPASLLPSARTQAAVAAQVAARRIDPARVAADVTAAADAAGFKPGTFDGFAATLPTLLDTTARLTYEGFASHGLGDLLDRSIVHRDGAWTIVTYLYPSTPAAVDTVRRVVETSGGRGRLSGLPEVNREMGRRFGPEFAKGIAAGSLVVVVLLVAAFRRWDLTLLALVPTVIALTWAAGILAAAGISLDLFSMFAVMTFVGIGVDYGIHLVHRSAHGPVSGRADAVSHLGPVILVAALTTLLGFGTLVTSSYPPLRLLGIVSAIAIVALGVASLFVLPALLLPRRPDRP